MWPRLLARTLHWRRAGAPARAAPTGAFRSLRNHN
jgi:hypothetical protein